MRAAIVFESDASDTRAAAEAVARGLRASGEVRLRAVDEVDDLVLRRADLIVLALASSRIAIFGGRRAGLPGAGRSTGGPRPDEAVRPIGTLLDWVRSMPSTFAPVAVFDVRPSLGRFAPRPMRPLLRELRRHEFEVVANPETFRVSRRRCLSPGEVERAERWGETLGDLAARARDG